MTPKQRVLKKYPKASCLRRFHNSWDTWIVLDNEAYRSIECLTPQAAWSDAAARIRRHSGDER